MKTKKYTLSTEPEFDRALYQSVIDTMEKTYDILVANKKIKAEDGMRTIFSKFVTPERIQAMALCKDLENAINALDEFAVKYQGLYGFGVLETGLPCLCTINFDDTFTIEKDRFSLITSSKPLLDEK